MKKRRKAALQNTCFVGIFAANNFVLILACMALTAGGALALLHFRLIPENFYLMPLTMLNFAFLLALAVSVVTAIINSRLSRRILQAILRAMKELAAGKFETKISFGLLPMPREYDELAAAFNDMAKELSGIEMMRADFINNFSHEFKTPIVSLQGFAKQLKRPGLTDAEREEYIDILVTETTRLSQLAANILELTRVEHQTILTGQAEYDLAEQLRRCFLLLESKWEAKGVEPELNLEEVTIRANEALLAQVWNNLLDNAIKFSLQGGKLRLFLSSDGEYATVRVQDFGCGMSAEATHHAFDKFYQGDPSRTTEGNGLGLAVVKRIVELHGGTVEARSAAGEGTVFTVVLPLL